MTYQFIGLVLRGINKQEVQCGDYITNCPRMKKAIELCGGKTINTTMIVGIESFCKFLDK